MLRTAESFVGTPDCAVMALEWLNAEQASRLLINRTAEVLWANDAAVAELAPGCGIEIRDGRLVFADPALGADLTATIAATPVGSCCLVCPGGEEHVLVRFNRIGNDDGDPVFGLTVRRCGSYKPTTAVDLGRAFGLTAGEHRVVLKLLDGHTAEDTAAELGIGIETVRSHIRQIYSKLGVRSREALFQRIMPYCL